jgi:hypothetical protein
MSPPVFYMEVIGVSSRSGEKFSLVAFLMEQDCTVLAFHDQVPETILRTRA